MSVPSQRRNNAQPGQPDFNTLDEPIKETIVSSAEIQSDCFDIIYINHVSFQAARFEGGWREILSCFVSERESHTFERM